MDRIFTLNEAREFLKVSDATIRRYVKSGKLKSQKFGRQFRISETAIKEFLDLQSVKEAEKDNHLNEVVHIDILFDKGFLEDSRISFTAKGLFMCILAKPDNHEINIRALTGPMDTIESLTMELKELERFGYIQLGAA